MKEYDTFPANICIRLNRNCNLSCAFCLASNKSEELSTKQLKTAIEYLKFRGIKKACLAGGEPTIRSDFIEIVEFCIAIGLKTVIYSNLFDIDNVFSDLVQYPISVTTSIHGNQSIHDLLTQPGAYEATYRNINKLISNNIDVSIHTVLMRKNYHCAEEIVQNAIAAGVKKLSFQTLIPREKGAKLFEETEDQEDIIERLHALYPLKETYANKIKIKFINLYKKNYYVLETDGSLYLQTSNGLNDELIQRVI